jgi:hypothetical protein
MFKKCAGGSFHELTEIENDGKENTQSQALHFRLSLSLSLRPEFLCEIPAWLSAQIMQDVSKRALHF